MGRLTAIVLGSAAGGGFPQWNDLGPVGRLAWQGDPRISLRSQAGIAVSGDGAHWVLINATPDLRSQIIATSALHPAVAPRHSPISSVVLTGAEVDQIAGLLTLRERQPFGIWATQAVLDVIDANPIFSVLAAEVVPRHTAQLDSAFDAPGGLSVELFAVPGKIPLHQEAGAPDLVGAADINAGVEIRAGGATLIYIPGAAALTAQIVARIARADVVLFDGTLFTDDEMIRTGTGQKSGRRMGHMPISGADGSLKALAELSNRRIYTHINNTNPVLVKGSAERMQVEATGWDVAYDGMEITL